jgi:acyl-coenzyme A synthetase/AMP-(fatty) acid ligase
LWVASGSTGKPKGICVQHCGVANVIAHKLAELRQAGIAAGSKMLNWMALNFGEHHVKAQHSCISSVMCRSRLRPVSMPY